MIKPLVDYYGSGSVWDRAIEVLGFPGTWVTNLGETRKINDRLRKEKER